MPKRLHHIDFVVRDLAQAAARYAQVLGVEVPPRERLPARGIELVRFRVGEVWLILLQPVTDDSPVATVLAEQGEGFFHLALQVDDVEEEAERLRRGGVRPLQDTPRRGVEGWKLIDLDPDETAGIVTQLIEEDAAAG